MPNRDAPPSSAFPGARSIYTPPVSANHFQILKWSKTGTCSPGPIAFVDPNADFINEGVQGGDPWYLVKCDEGWTLQANVFMVVDPVTLIINEEAPDTCTNGWYKVGRKTIHTFGTLLGQLKAAGPYSGMIRWGWIWSNALSADYAPDKSGKLITIEDL